MSGESSAHIRLVETLITAVELRYTGRRGFVLFADHHRFGADRPPTIGGFSPDLFASDVPDASFRVIGEAKTPKDLESDRTRRQLAAFLDHLTLYPGSAFILAVPFFFAARGRAIVGALRPPVRNPVEIEVLACALRC